MYVIYDRRRGLARGLVLVAEFVQEAIEFVGGRGFDGDRRACDRMVEAEFPGMKGLAAKFDWGLARGGVGGVPDDGMADVEAVDTNLVGTSGFETEVHQGVVA